MGVCQASAYAPYCLISSLQTGGRNEDVYMATTFGDFIQLLVRKLRGEDEENECIIDYVSPGP
jgi:hypothetical protein